MIVHLDQDGQYAESNFRKLLDRHHLLQSMNRANIVYDNAFIVALFSRFRAELLEGGAFQNHD